MALLMGAATLPVLFRSVSPSFNQTPYRFQRVRSVAANCHPSYGRHYRRSTIVQEPILLRRASPDLPKCIRTSIRDSFLTGRDRSGRLVLKRWQVDFDRRRSASELVCRRTIARPKLGTPNGPDKRATGRLCRFRLNKGVLASSRRSLCKAGAEECEHEK